jgi:hypothetical protein
MRRLSILCLLAIAPLLSSCAKTYTYQSYEVIWSFTDVQQGEDLKLVRKDGELVQGTVVQVVGDVVTVATYDKGRKKVRWEDVKIVERVKKAVVVVP